MEREPHYSARSSEGFPPVKRHPVHVVLDNLRSAFNVGSIFRTADAGAVKHIHLCGMTARPPNLKLAKTALGAQDYVPWSYHRDPTEALATLRNQEIPCVAVEVAEGAISHVAYPWPSPVAIVFGHEVRGITPGIMAACDAMVCIPMAGYKNTINVATAFGVVLYEILRQWKVLDVAGRQPSQPGWEGRHER